MTYSYETAEARIARLEERLEIANNAVEALLETLSHDLRTPLNSILGFADMMDQSILGSIENPTYRSYIADICREGRSMLDILNDLLDRQRFQSQERSEKDFRHMIELAPDLISVCRDGVIHLINPAGANMLGLWPVGTLIGRRFDEFVHEDFQDFISDGLDSLTTRTSRLPLRLRRVGGTDVDVELAALDYDGFETGGPGRAVMLIARDVSDRNRALRQAAARATRIRTIMNTVVDGIITINSSGVIDTINPAAEDMLGYDRGELLGKNVEIIMGENDRHAHVTKIERFLQTNHSDTLGRSREVTAILKDGSEVPIILSVSSFKSDGEHIFIGTLHDNTERKRAEMRLREMATLDPLTKMPNRLVRNERLGGAIKHAAETRTPFSYMFVDLDNFKNINDALGHAAGDDVICQAGERLVATVRDKGLVAHLGGDEFSVIVDRISTEMSLEQLVEEAQSALENPYEIDGKEVFAPASIGVASFPEAGDTASILMKNAELAVHEAKRKGAGICQFYFASLSHDLERRMDIERGLRRALAKNEFHLVFQPKVDLDTYSIVGAEALLRWQSEDLGSVTPDEFIPVAEQCGLIGEIGRWVLYHACETASGWPNLVDGPCHVGVNFSAAQFLERDIVDWVEGCLHATGLSARNLDVELTESMLISNPEHTISVLNSMKELGITVSMDDFGTGYSSLSYLTKFPLNTLKVDRAFVANSPGDRDAVTVALAIISMAKQLKLKIVAEGIETESQVGFLHSLGCHTGQGYLFGKPVAGIEFEKLIGGNAGLLQAI